MKIRLGDLRGAIRQVLHERMTVDVYLDDSDVPGAGVGLFAGQDVPAGTDVFVWDPRVDQEYSPENVEGLQPEEFQEFQDLASWDGDVWSLAGDEGAYFNHSRRPNVAAVPQDGIRPARWRRVALRDIRGGDEMLMDYSQIGSDVPD
jgi:hypothetical protein